MGKMKIHELAKKLGLTSKELLEKAKSLNIEAKSHLSTLEEKEVELLEKSFGKKQESKSKETKKEKNDTPVIIRREVIINDDEEQQKQKEEQIKKKR